MRFAVVALLAVAALLSGTAYFILRAQSDGDLYAACRQTRIAGGASALGGPFSLIDETGRQVSQADVITKPSLVYFGYTYCPDVCPIDAVRNSATIELLAEAGHDVGSLFISVDPARDTPEVLAEYTSYFDDVTLGLTGSDEDVARAAKAFRVYYARQGNEGDEDYLVAHSNFTYLVGSDAKVVEVFRGEVEAEPMAQSLACFIDKMS